MGGTDCPPEEEEEPAPPWVFTAAEEAEGERVDGVDEAEDPGVFFLDDDMVGEGKKQKQKGERLGGWGWVRERRREREGEVGVEKYEKY